LTNVVEKKQEELFSLVGQGSEIPRAMTVRILHPVVLLVVLLLLLLVVLHHRHRHVTL